MTNSGNASSGCFSGIARLLLCKGSLRTHPSDQIMDPNTTQFADGAKKLEPKKEAQVVAPPQAAAPGVVARLMGLDSLPDANWVPKSRTPDSVTRSRSVNFMDYLLELDIAKAAQHRRVRTSVSFREVPTVHNKQNHDLFVLYLDNVDKKKKMGSKLGKSEAGLGDTGQNNEIKKNKNPEKQKNQRKNMKISKLMDEPRRVVSKKQSSRFGSCERAQVSPAFASPRKKGVVNRKTSEITSKVRSCERRTMNRKEELVESNFIKKMKKQGVIKDIEQSECSSQDSSPVSVLDLNESCSICDDQTLLSEDVGIWDLKNCSSKARSIGHGELKTRAAFKENDRESTGNGEYYMDIVRKLWEWTEEDIKESNEWTRKEAYKFEGFEDICRDFGKQILDLLIHQLAEELTWARI